MGMVIDAVDKFLARCSTADLARGHSNTETPLQKETRLLKEKLQRARAKENRHYNPTL